MIITMWYDKTDLTEFAHVVIIKSSTPEEELKQSFRIKLN
jgi:hypothetical protein